MNDSQMEARVKDAFDAIVVPDELMSRTMAAIDGLERPSGQMDASGEPIAPKLTPISSGTRRAKRRRRRWIPTSAIAACVAFACALFGVQVLNTTPTAFVDIDVNPSIELELNRFDKVIDAHASNDDGAAVLDGVSIEGLSYEEALTVLMQSASFAPYLDSDAYVQFSVVTDDSSQEQALMRASEECIARMPVQGSCHSVSSEVHAEAHDAGMGCGRYLAASELVQLDPSLSIEDCRGMSMAELRNRIASCQEGHASQGQQGGGMGGQGMGQQGSGSGQGHHAEGRGHHGS